MKMDKLNLLHIRLKNMNLMIYVKHVTNGIPAAMVLFHISFVFSKVPYPYLQNFRKYNKSIVTIILQ